MKSPRYINRRPRLLAERRSDSCKYCGTHVLWAVNRSTGNKTPLELPMNGQPGRILLDLGTITYISLDHEAVRRTIDRGDTLYINHVVTCPGWDGVGPLGEPTMTQHNHISRRRAGAALAVTCLAALAVLAQQPRTTARTTQAVIHRPGIQNPSALTHFFSALTDLESGQRTEPVRIMHFGDSHAAADILTGEIRRNFQQEFGDGGAGYLAPYAATKQMRRAVSSGASSGWRTDGLKPSPGGIYGPGGVSLTTSRPGERLWLQTSGNYFELYFLSQPGGGAIDILLDGVRVLQQPISLAGPTRAPAYCAFEATRDTYHRIEIRTVGSGVTRVLGIVAEHNRPGIAYDVLGINGARAARLISWNYSAFADNLAERNPDLIIIAYGTNEAADNNWTIPSYQRLITTIIHRLQRAAPRASILVYGPPDRGDCQLAARRMTAMIKAQRRAAFEAGAAFWSSYSAMGGWDSINSWVAGGWAQPDRVHLSRAGYIQMGRAFYTDMLRTYKISTGLAK